jgi:outer membrane protein TolC
MINPMRWIPLFLLAAGPAAADVVTLADAAREALAANPERAAAHAAVDAAEERLRAAAGDFAPALSASASLDKDGDGGAFREAGPWTHSAGLTLRQNLFDGLKTQAGLDGARARRDAARARLAAATAQTLEDARVGHNDLLYAQENERLARTIAERRRDNRDLVGLRFDGGREHKGSFLRIQAAFTQALYDVDRAAREVLLARAALARAMGRALETPLMATGTYVLPVPPLDPDLPGLTLETPAARRVAAEARATDAALAVARGALWPSLDASLSQSWSGEDGRFPDAAWRGGVSASWTLFAGGSRRAAARAARADQRAAAASLQDTRQATHLALRSAWVDHQNAHQALGVRSEFLRAAQVRAEIARGQYTSGLLAFEDWDLIENDLIENEKQALLARRTAARAAAAWDRALGKGALP